MCGINAPLADLWQLGRQQRTLQLSDKATDGLVIALGIMASGPLTCTVSQLENTKKLVEETTAYSTRIFLSDPVDKTSRDLGQNLGQRGAQLSFFVVRNYVKKTLVGVNKTNNEKSVKITKAYLHLLMGDYFTEKVDEPSPIAYLLEESNSAIPSTVIPIIGDIRLVGGDTTDAINSFTREAKKIIYRHNLNGLPTNLAGMVRYMFNN